MVSRTPDLDDLDGIFDLGDALIEKLPSKFNLSIVEVMGRPVILIWKTTQPKVRNAGEELEKAIQHIKSLKEKLAQFMIEEDMLPAE